MVTVSEYKFCEFATIQNSFHDVCYDDVHMHVSVCMDTHVYMHIYMHLCACPHHVCLCMHHGCICMCVYLSLRLLVLTDTNFSGFEK